MRKHQNLCLPATTTRSAAVPSRAIFCGAVSLGPILRSAVLLFGAILCVAVFPSGVHGAERKAPFETLTVSVSFVANVNDNEFHELWDPGSGARLQAMTPFHRGNIGLGLHFFKNESVTAGVPDFRLMYLYLMWAFERSAPRGSTVSGGVSAGSVFMDFAADAFGDLSEIESELGLGIHGRVGREIGDRWSVFAGGEYRVVMTALRIKLGFVSVGLARELSAPGWLKGFFE